MTTQHDIQEILAIKQRGEELTGEQIKWCIQAVVNKQIADVQIGALLMAIFLKGKLREAHR